MKRGGKPRVDSRRALFACSLRHCSGIRVALFRQMPEILVELDCHRGLFNGHHVIGIDMDCHGLTDKMYR